MRKALITLSGAGIIASLILASCVVKENDDDDDDGKAGKSSTSTKSTTGNATGNNSTTAAKGGSTSTSTVGSTSGGSTSTSTGTPSSGGTSGGTAEPACPDLMTKLSQGSNACSTSEQAASYAHINMLIVLDKSGSMSHVPTGDTQTKWAGATAALAAALNPKDTLLSYGFMLFPYSTGTSQQCDLAPLAEDAVNIKVTPAADSVPQINTLMAATTPSGGTPTAKALKAAFEYYTTGSGLALEGKKYVLLVTDGGPNCNSTATPSCDASKCTSNLDASCSAGVANCCDPSMLTAGGPNPLDLCLDDASVTAQLDALRAANINTFVIGIPGTEAYASYLDLFAESGGVALTPTTEKPHKYYEVKNQAELVTTFTKITTSLVRDCMVHLKEAPKDLTKINVAIDCSEVPEKTAEGTVNWTYSNATGTDPVIEVQGARCEAIKAAGVKRIDVVNGCPKIVVE